mgnify:CR=1 FL=1
MQSNEKRLQIGRPQISEYDPYFQSYLDAVPEGDIGEILAEQIRAVTENFAPFAGSAGNLPYQEGKWTAKEVLSHLIDSERVFMYRILRIARRDATPLAGFDQDWFVAAANANRREMARMLTEFAFLRKANLLMLEDFDQEALLLKGTANGKSISVRAIAFVMAGHINHHLVILRDRYTPILSLRV